MSVAAPDRPSDDDNLLHEALDVINELATKSTGGDYLYRGEPERYPKVASGLYRKYEKLLPTTLTLVLSKERCCKPPKNS